MGRVSHSRVGAVVSEMYGSERYRPHTEREGVLVPGKRRRSEEARFGKEKKGDLRRKALLFASPLERDAGLAA